MSEGLRLRFWGTRGSVPAPGPRTVRYGGNTSCVEMVLSDEESLILDAGTGLREYGLSSYRHHGRLNILLTHLHMDHIQGLAFFGPLHCPGCEIHIWGPGSPVNSLAEQLEKYISPPLFPVPLTKIPGVVCHDLGEEHLEIGSVKIESRRVAHRGTTLGYRLHANGMSVAYVPDHEPALASGMTDKDHEWVSGYELARDVDVLLHDGQYDNEEYPLHLGWGHSSVSDTVAFARMCTVGRLVLFHHDPEHTDEQCDALLEQARDLWDGPREAIVAACEGTELDLERWVADAKGLQSLGC